MEKQKLPNASTALVMGILSILTACCCAFPGPIFGFIGLNMAKKAKATYEANPEQYNGEGNVEAGRITSIIGIVLGILMIIYVIYAISVAGGISEFQEEFQRAIEEAQQNQ